MRDRTVPAGDRPERARDVLLRRFPDASAEELYELVQTDWLFRMPTLSLAEAQVAAGGRAHVYELAWTAPALDGALGAFHALDVPLIFGTIDAARMVTGGQPSPEARRAVGPYAPVLGRFRRHRAPGWPAYDSGQRLTQVFDTEPAVTPYPEEISRRLWRDHTFPALPLLAP